MYKFTNRDEPWNIQPIKNVSFSSDTKKCDGMILEARVLEAIIYNYIFKSKKFDMYRFLKLNNYVIKCTKVEELSFNKKLTDLVNDLTQRIKELWENEYTPVIIFSSGNYKMYMYKEHLEKIKYISDIINIYYQTIISFAYI